MTEIVKCGLHFFYNFAFMLFSVIIPVYNAESTLARCVSSVLSQRDVDMEVILVDDGSTDSSLSICRNLASTDARVSLITKPNGGLSSARNAGIEVARGEYVTFVDSDDSITTNLYHDSLSAMAVMGWPDMAEFGIRLFVGAPWERQLSFKQKLYSEPYDYWFSNQVWAHCYACNKLFRRRLFASVRFPEGKYFEDSCILPQLLSRCGSVATLSVGSYNYIFNSGGITSSADARRFSDLLDAEIATLKGIPASVKDMYNDRMPLYYEHILNNQLTAYELGAAELKLPLLPYRNTIKQKLLHVIGLKSLCILNKTIHKIRPPRH